MVKLVINPNHYDDGYYGIDGAPGKEFVDKDGTVKRHSSYKKYGDWVGWTSICPTLNKIFAPSSILDVGCGPGSFVAYCRRFGMSAWGIDSSRKAIAKPYMEARGYLDYGDVRKNPHDDGSFDLVTALDVMEHIPRKDSEIAVLECMRVARSHVFFNIAVRREDEPDIEFDEDEVIPVWAHPTVIAGHINVKTCGWWRTLIGEMCERSGEWVIDDELEEEFRAMTSPRALENWLCTIILSRREE